MNEHEARQVAKLLLRKSKQIARINEEVAPYDNKGAPLIKHLNIAYHMAVSLSKQYENFANDVKGTQQELPF